jgi:hypothetical protein
MRQTSDRAHGAPRLAQAVVRLSRQVAAVIAECNYAQRRMIALFLAPDRYANDSHRAPDTYAEFLFRTSGLLHREPSARDRATH